MKKIMRVLLAGLLVMGLAACQEKEPPVSGGDLTDEPGKVRIFNEGGDQVHSSGARYVRVDGALYTDTGEIITLARCGVMDGEITKTVAETELPGEDDCSNFGTGYQYQIAGVYSIDVVIDGDWCRFQREVPSCSYAEEASALGLAMAADPTAATIQTEGFICTGEEAAPDVETAIQLTLTELNENLREIYIEAYSLPDTSEYIYLHTTAELKQIFGENFPDDTESDFYEMEIGTAGLMRSYMARKCDIHFPLERKLSRFLTAAMRVYRVPEAEQAKVLAFIQSLDIKAIATEVMYKLFAMLEMKYDFKLSKNNEMEETR